MGHRVESVAKVEAFDPGPLVVLNEAEENADHTLLAVSTSVHDDAAVYGRQLLL